MVVFKDVKKEDVHRLKDIGMIASEPKTVYEVIRYVGKGVTAILYTSGKLFLQGKEDAVERIASKLKGIGEEVKKIEFRKETGWIIGSDESIKGDTFGGLVVAGVKADDKIRSKLLELGVADSKILKDDEIIKLARDIKRLVPCEIWSIMPEEYNKSEGLTVLLNKMHRKVAKGLGVGKHVVDKYPGCNAGDIMETKAEQKYIEVAAASILARSAGLEQFDYLSMQAGFELPKGSTHVKEALEKLKEKGFNLSKFVKMHFKNVTEYL